MPHLFESLEQSAKLTPIDFARFVRTQLSSFQHRTLRNLFRLIHDDGGLNFNHRDSSLLNDFICSRLSLRLANSESEKKFVAHKKLSIFFDNKALDFINLPQILNSDEVTRSLPDNDKDDNIAVFFKLRPPIRSKILNYRQFVTTDDFCMTDDCDCSSCQFTDTGLGHVCTGDLRIVQNSKLKRLLMKGPNYREPVPINWLKARDCIKDGLQRCVSQWKTKASCRNNDYFPFISTVLKLVDDKIATSRISHNKFRPNKPVLRDPDALAELSRLQKLYVIVPVDKAAKNFSFICKKFYKETLEKELGLDSDNSGSLSYEAVTTSKADVLAKQLGFIDSNGFAQQFDSLPFMYLIPKFHKIPTKFRFIVCSSRCATKSVSQPLTKALARMP